MKETKLQRYQREQQENLPYLYDDRYCRPGDMQGKGLIHEVVFSRKTRGTRSEMLVWCHQCSKGRYGVLKVKDNCWKFKFSDAGSAMMFKLTWGGNL